MNDFLKNVRTVKIWDFEATEKNLSDFRTFGRDYDEVDFFNEDYDVTDFYRDGRAFLCGGAVMRNIVLTDEEKFESGGEHVYSYLDEETNEKHLVLCFDPDEHRD